MKAAIKLDGLLRLTRLDKFALTSENLYTASWSSCCEMIGVVNRSILTIDDNVGTREIFHNSSGAFQ